MERLSNQQILDARGSLGDRGLYVWVGSLLFAACGLFIGYLLPAENVMQLMGL